MSVIKSRRSRSKRDRVSNLINDVVLWLVLLVFFIPALWIILTSLRNRSEINSHPPVWIPQGLTLKLLQNTIWDANPGRRIWNGRFHPC